MQHLHVHNGSATFSVAALTGSRGPQATPAAPSTSEEASELIDLDGLTSVWVPTPATRAEFSSPIEACKKGCILRGGLSVGMKFDKAAQDCMGWVMKKEGNFYSCEGESNYVTLRAVRSKQRKVNRRQKPPPLAFLGAGLVQVVDTPPPSEMSEIQKQYLLERATSCTDTYRTSHAASEAGLSLAMGESFHSSPTQPTQIRDPKLRLQLLMNSDEAIERRTAALASSPQSFTPAILKDAARKRRSFEQMVKSDGGPTSLMARIEQECQKNKCWEELMYVIHGTAGQPYSQQAPLSGLGTAKTAEKGEEDWDELRDMENKGMTLEDFTTHPSSVEAALEKAEVIALRLFTGPCYASIAQSARSGTMSWAGTVVAINLAIVKLSQFSPAAVLWHGFQSRELSKLMLLHKVPHIPLPSQGPPIIPNSPTPWVSYIPDVFAHDPLRRIGPGRASGGLTGMLKKGSRGSVSTTASTIASSSVTSLHSPSQSSHSDEQRKSAGPAPCDIPSGSSHFPYHSNFLVCSLSEDDVIDCLEEDEALMGILMPEGDTLPENAAHFSGWANLQWVAQYPDTFQALLPSGMVMCPIGTQPPFPAATAGAGRLSTPLHESELRGTEGRPTFNFTAVSLSEEPVGRRAGFDTKRFNRKLYPAEGPKQWEQNFQVWSNFDPSFAATSDLS